MAAQLARGARITGPQRQELAAELARRYQAGESIRALAEDTGRSFGFVHGLVKESGVTLRGRGGATRGAAAEAARAARGTSPLAPSSRTAETPLGDAVPDSAKPKAKKTKSGDGGGGGKDAKDAKDAKAKKARKS